MVSKNAKEALVYHCLNANCSLLGKKYTREMYTAILIRIGNFLICSLDELAS